MEWQSISRASLSVFNLHRSTIAAASSSIHVVALCRRHRRGSPPRPHALDPAGGKGGRAPHCPVLRRRRPTRERWEARRRKRRGGGGAAEVDDGVLGRAHARKGGGGVQPLVRIEGKEKGADAAGYLGKGMRATLGELRDLRRGRRRPMEGRMGAAQAVVAVGSRRPPPVAWRTRGMEKEESYREGVLGDGTRGTAAAPGDMPRLAAWWPR